MTQNISFFASFFLSPFSLSPFPRQTFLFSPRHTTWPACTVNIILLWFMCHKILQVTVTPVSGSERPLKSMGALGKKKKSTLVPKNLRANFVDFDHVRSPICHITSKGLHISVIRAEIGPEKCFRAVFYRAVTYFKHLFHTENVSAITFIIILAFRFTFLESLYLGNLNQDY